MVSLIFVCACGIWKSFFYLGVQEVFIDQIDVKHQMVLATFQQFVFPASPPLESLLLQRSWKCSGFFNCQFNLPPSVIVCVCSQRPGAHLPELSAMPHPTPGRESLHVKEPRMVVEEEKEGGSRKETHCYGLHFLNYSHLFHTDRI